MTCRNEKQQIDLTCQRACYEPRERITQIENASKSCVNLRMIENMNQDRTHICSDKVPTVFDILLGLSITNYVCPHTFVIGLPIF